MNEYEFINELKEHEQRSCKAGQTQINYEIRDARVSTFYFMAQVIRSLKIYLILKKKYLDRREWYDEVYLSKYEQQWPAGVSGKTLQTIEDHNMLTIVVYTQVLFSTVQQMTLDSNALKGKSNAFYHVYTWLLPRVNKHKTQYQNLIKVFSYIRNTIHNNGQYMDTEHPYVSIEYRQ